MATAKIDMEFVVISKDELRQLIREEVRKLVEPGAQRPDYLPPYPGYPNYEPVLPQVWCGTAESVVPKDANQIVMN